MGGVMLEKIKRLTDAHIDALAKFARENSWRGGWAALDDEGREV